MEMKPGYKQTEIGVIPVEWEVKSMKELFTFQNGVNADKAAYGKGVPFINVLEVITCSTITEDKIPGKIFLPANAIAAFAVHYGDVLFNRTSETQEEVGLASVYVGTAAVVFGGFVIRARPRDRRMNPAFTALALRSLAVRAQIIALGQGAIRANIGQQDLSRVQVFLPRLAEQEAIAEALSDADALIESLEQLIAKKRNVKQGAMQELLTGKKRLSGFQKKPGLKQTEMGMIPEDWNVAKLAAVCSMKSGEGITSASIDQFSQYPCYGGNGLRGFATRFTHDGGYALIGRQGALCGNVLGVEGKFFASEHAIVVTAFARTDIRWLTFVLGRMRLNQYSESSAQPGLSVSKLQGLGVPCPPTKVEQEAIATILSDMDTEISALEEKLAKSRQIKQGMMQELLTGKTRLV